MSRRKMGASQAIPFQTRTAEHVRSDADGAEEAPEVGWVRDAIAGDPQAFRALHKRYARLIHGVLLSRVPADDVDDLVQDVFLTAWQRLSSLRDATAFSPWLVRIARNRAVDHLRRKPKLTVVPLPETLSEPPSRRAEANEVLKILLTLPESYRETLLLRLVEGMTGPEIARATGLTPGSVRVNLHRGMKMLKEKLEGGTS